MEKSSGLSNSLLRILAFLAAVLLVLVIPLSMLSNNIIRTLFSPDEISEPVVSLLLLRGGIRDQLTDNLISDIWQEDSLGGESEALKFLSVQERFQITQSLFPKDWVREQVRGNLDILITWIESDEALPELIIDLNPLKENIGEGGSNRIAEIVVDSWPKCGVQQGRQLEAALQNDSAARFVFCRADGDLYQRTIDHVEHQILQFRDNIPGNIPLWDQINQEDGFPVLEEFRQSVLDLLRLLNFLKPMPFFFLGILLSLLIRSWQDLGRWWGIPLVVGALWTLILMILLHGIGPGILKNAMVRPEQIPELQESIVDAVWELLAKILNQSGIQALVTGIIGLAFYLLSRRSKKKPSEPSPAAVSEDTTMKKAEEIPPPPQVEPFDPDNLEVSSRKDPSQ